MNTASGDEAPNWRQLAVKLLVLPTVVPPTRGWSDGGAPHAWAISGHAAVAEQAGSSQSVSPLPSLS